jgi:hypothetical protein
MSAASAQFSLVKLLAGRKVAACEAETDVPFGVLLNSPNQGEPALVAVSGQTKLRVGAASLAEAAVIGIDAAGRARPLTAGTGTTLHVVGRVLDIDAATNAGGLVSAWVDLVKPTRNA